MNKRLREIRSFIFALYISRESYLYIYIVEAISMADKVVVLTQRPAKIKAIHEIHLSVEDRTPLKSREAPEFREYFNLLWKELKSDEE